MGGRGSSSSGSRGRGGGIPMGRPTPAPTPVQPVQSSSVDDGKYYQMSDADAINLINKYGDKYNDPDFVTARKLYISSADANGDGFSYSQNLNYKLDNGIKLDANEKWINQNLQNAMHPLGKGTKLVRYCHDDILQQCGIKDYTKLTEQQLQSKLVGTKLQSTSYISTSYNSNKSPFHPNAPMGGGREVLMNIKAKGNTKGVFGEKKQTEIILDKGTSMKITGVHYDGTYATPRNGRRKPRIVVDIETS